MLYSCIKQTTFDTCNESPSSSLSQLQLCDAWSWFCATQTTGTTEADRSFNDLNSKSPKAKQRAAIAQKATFKGSAKSMPARLPAAAAADVTEAGSKVIAKTAMRTITKIVRTAGRALGPIGVLVEVAGIAFSLYEEITDILEVGQNTFSCFEYNAFTKIALRSGRSME